MDAADAVTETFGADCTYHYERKDYIGGGAFGAVYKAVVTAKGNYTGEETVAVKETRLGHADTKLYRESNEACKLREKWKALVGLQHKNVVPYYKITCSFTSHGCLMLEVMMEYAEENSAQLTKKVAVNLAWQIADGLAYLHQNRVIHGDLKPENVLVKPLKSTSMHQKYLLQLADVDNCVQLQRSVTCSKDVDLLIGTYRYMSPEMIKKFLHESKDIIGRRTDVWSAGCIFHDLFDCSVQVKGRWLCKGEDRVKITRSTTHNYFVTKIADGYVPYISLDIPAVLSCILRRCMMVNISERMSASLVMETLREVYLDFSEDLGIGLKIGTKFVSIAVLRNGVPRFLTAFPSLAAYKSNPTISECYFGSEAQGRRRSGNYNSVEGLKHLLYAYGGENPVILERLFAHIIKLLNSYGIHSTEHITMVLPQSINKNTDAHRNISQALKRNLVHHVTLICPTSANFLAYASSEIEYELIRPNGKPSSPITHVVICIAGYNHFQLEAFQISRRDYYERLTNGDAILLNCMADMRTAFIEAICDKVVTDEITSPNRLRIHKEVQEECEELLRLFLEEQTDTAVIHVDGDISITVDRKDFVTIAQTAVGEIQRFATDELVKCGLIDSKDRTRTNGSFRILLFGKHSKFLALRNFLEALQQLPLDKTILSYVDHSEVLGAAVASYLDNSSKTPGLTADGNPRWPSKYHCSLSVIGQLIQGVSR